MPKIPRYGPPRRSSGAPSIDLGSILAPYREAANLAETAQKAVTAPALAILDKQLEEATKARRLAFEAQTAKDTAALVNTVNERITALANVGDSQGIHRFFTDELDGIIEGQISGYTNELEQKEVRAQLIETGAGMYSQAVKAATIADLKNATQGYENAMMAVQDSVRSGALPLSEALSKFSSLAEWAQAGNLRSTEDAALDIDAAFKGASRLAVAGAIDRAQAVSSTNYGQALRIIDDAIKTVPPQVDESMKDWARGELGQYRMGLVKAQSERVSQLERIEISNAVRDIEDGRRLGKPSVVERGFKTLDRIKDSASDPENRLRASGYRSNFEIDGAMAQAESIYSDTQRAEAAVAGGAPVTFDNPARGENVLNNALRQRREMLGPAGSGPVALSMDARNAMLNNTQGIVPSEAVKYIGQIADGATKDPDVMKILVSTMDDLPAVVQANLYKTPQGRIAYQMARAYQNTYRAKTAGVVDPNAFSVAENAAFQAGVAAAKIPNRGGKDFATIQDERRKYVQSDEWKEQYSSLYSGGWLISTDFEKAVREATGMNAEEFSAFIGPESASGVNLLVHEDIRETTQRNWVESTPLGDASDEDTISDALRLAVGTVMNRWKWSRGQGFIRGGATGGTPTLQMAAAKMNGIFDEVVAAGKLPESERDRFVRQDGFTVIGDDNTGYSVIQPGVMLAPIWTGTGEQLNRSMAERDRKRAEQKRIQKEADALLEEGRKRFGAGLDQPEQPETIVRGGE